jgi:hypothetical protein
MYVATIVRIKNVRKHPNADKLNLGTCLGSQVIVSLETKEDDIGVYFPTDGQLSLEFCKANGLLKQDGGYLDENKRHISTLKLRGEFSDGLFMPIKSLESFMDVNELKVGKEIEDPKICQKYFPRTNGSNRKIQTEKVRAVPKKTVSCELFKKHIDTGQLQNNLHRFSAGNLVILTLKMHGTSGRTGYLPVEKKVYLKGLKALIRKIQKKSVFDIVAEKRLVSGSRRVDFLEAKDTANAFYKTDFRTKYHEMFEGVLKYGETVYYEIVGFEEDGRSIMETVDNSKIGDKAFVKEYGPTTTYHYGLERGQNDIYIYRITRMGIDGTPVELTWDETVKRASEMGIKTVPEFERFIFTTEDDMLKRVAAVEGGADPIGKTHIREGVVVRIEGQSSFAAFKQKNVYFKCLEGIIKDLGILDREEIESLEEE